MTVLLKKDEKGNKERYKLEFWIGKDGNVEDGANAYPVLARPSEGGLSAQEAKTQVKFAPSVELKALIKAEQKIKVDEELAK